MGIELRGLSGKRVLVTGGAKGQGFNHVKAFADAGCDIAVLDITEPIPDFYPLATSAMLDATVEEVEARGRRCIGLPCDIRDEDQVSSAVGKAQEYFDGPFDILVNNAGIASMAPVHELTGYAIDVVVDTIVKGTIYLTKHVVPGMIYRRSGKIINITSGVTADGVAMLSHYVAAKHAVDGLTKTWAFELSEFNINVNAVAPGVVRPGDGQGSGMIAGVAETMGMAPLDAYEHLSDDCSLVGDKWRVVSQNITDGVLFLASANADQITGHTLRVDGGESAK